MISSSEVPTTFERGAKAKELRSTGALVEQPLERVLPLPGTCPRQILDEKMQKYLVTSEKINTEFLQISQFPKVLYNKKL